MMGYNTFRYKKSFTTDSGRTLPGIDIAYTTEGVLNKRKDNVIWLIHALTGNSNPLEWWGELTGKGKLFDTDKYFVICANNPGSCYGSTGPGSVDKTTGKRYGKRFPALSVQDIVKSFEILRKHLGLKKILLGAGGSLGGQILLEWAVHKPVLFDNIIPIATNAVHSAWGIAFNESQRMALENPKMGLETARAIAMLSYRSYGIYELKQTDCDFRDDNFSASSYQRYQGKKLRSRFSAESYYTLSKTMDAHNLGRGRESVKGALQRIKARTLIIGIKSDILFPVSEQMFLSENIPNSTLTIIDSLYGHDGFLAEQKKIEKAIKRFIKLN